MSLQQMLCKLWRTAAVSRRAVQEAQRAEDRQSLPARQEGIASARYPDKKGTKAALEALRRHMQWCLEPSARSRSIWRSNTHTKMLDSVRRARPFKESFSSIHSLFSPTHSVGNSSRRCNLPTISIKSFSFPACSIPCLTKKSSTTNAQFGLNSPFSMACFTSSTLHR